MIGTSVYSVLFYACTVILMVLIAPSLIALWKPVVIATKQKADGNDVAMPSLTKPVIRTVVILTMWVVAVTLGWNLKQYFTTTISSYQTPTEISESRKIQESTLPTREEFDRVRETQQQRTEIKPHEEAIRSFEDNMKREDEKIRQRSLNQK